MSSDTCVECGASFIGEPIPKYEHQADCEEQKDRHEARTGERRCFCLPYGESTHFRREIGHQVTGVFDGILFWTCPDCGYAWPRFTDGRGRLTAIAKSYTDEINAARRAVTA